MQPAPGLFDAQITIKHLAITTYAVSPEKLRPLIPQPWDLQTIRLDNQPQALISVVMLQNTRIRSARFPSPWFNAWQTNYRVYIRDPKTGQNLVWFFPSTVGSAFTPVARFVAKLPWQRGYYQVHQELEHSGMYYETYQAEVLSSGANAYIKLEPGKVNYALEGFPDEELAQLILTHPLMAVYNRLDGKPGALCLWHEKLQPYKARLKTARLEFLDRKKIVTFSDQNNPHSVLVIAEAEFTTHLPPLKGERIWQNLPIISGD